MNFLPPRSKAEVDVYLSEGFRELLAEMTYNYILERPPDPVDFALEFLTQRKKEHYSVFDRSPTEKKSPSPAYPKRRNSILAMQFTEQETMEYVHFPKSPSQKIKLMQAVKRAKVFQSLDEYSRERVMDAMRLVNVSAGDVIIRQGTMGEQFYVVQSGIFEAVMKDGPRLQQLKVYKNSGSFGDHGLVFMVPRVCTVTAKTDGELWVLDKKTFRSLVIKCEYQRRKMLELLLEMLPIFSLISEEERMDLVDLLVLQDVEAGQLVIHEGDQPNGMYIIISGEARVTIDGRQVAELSSGELFGELALITARPRFASVHAITDLHLAFLGVTDFERVLGRYIDMLKRDLNVFQTEISRLLAKYAIKSLNTGDFR